MSVCARAPLSLVSACERVCVCVCVCVCVGSIVLGACVCVCVRGLNCPWCECECVSVCVCVCVCVCLCVCGLHCPWCLCVCVCVCVCSIVPGVSVCVCVCVSVSVCRCVFGLRCPWCVCGGGASVSLVYMSVSVRAPLSLVSACERMCVCVCVCVCVSVCVWAPLSLVPVCVCVCVCVCLCVRGLHCPWCECECVSLCVCVCSRTGSTVAVIVTGHESGRAAEAPACDRPGPKAFAQVHRRPRGEQRGLEQRQLLWNLRPSDFPWPLGIKRRWVEGENSRPACTLFGPIRASAVGTREGLPTWPCFWT
ncbi:keratin-associated protein 5-1-like [Neofelis nebulosa]|uniref:keratin-associated protein 5-1-like n=1 Tax=Neofelis nebulosa TaxID=61452 RepID=UPI002729AEDD|nr:keratin-associated protein 5-1-like [Neofelis nebulosa]